MGDRVLIVATDERGSVTPAVYGHWCGHDAPAMLVAAGEAGIIRKDDPHNAIARICGFFHESNPRSTTSLGIHDAPADLTDETLRDYSHGNAGVIVVNVSDGSLRYVAGYLGRPVDPDDYEEGDTLPEPAPTAIKLSS